MNKIAYRVQASFTKEQSDRIDELGLIFSMTKKPISKSAVLRILVEQTIFQQNNK